MASADNPFLLEVARWRTGTTAAEAPSLREAEQYCAALAKAHYENFPVVSWFLPKALHQHFFNVYAFCRWADDLGDETGDPLLSRELLAWWRDELQECYAGRFRHPVFVALRPTIDQFAIPAEPFEALISAFEQDQVVRDYADFPQLVEYCRRSANPVGRLVLRMAQADSPPNIEWSDAICTGLQLANFWQDVARDYQIGRIYLPREDRLRFGISEADLAAGRTIPAFQALLEFEVQRARQYLLEGQPLVEAVPPWLQLDIDLFCQGGLRILREIERINYRVWEVRPVVTKGAALGMLCGSLWRSVGRWWRRPVDRTASQSGASGSGPSVDRSRRN